MQLEGEDCPQPGWTRGGSGGHTPRQEWWGATRRGVQAAESHGTGSYFSD